MNPSLLNQNIIKLKLIPSIGNKTILNILQERAKDLQKCDLEIDLIEKLISHEQKESFEKYSKSLSEKLERVLSDLDKRRIKIVNIQDPDYPEALRRTFDPPALLFYQGDLNYDYHKSLAVVGTRNSSLYGKNACEKIIEGLVNYNMTIISGLATGIDSIAHKSALGSKMKCIAVVGQGLNYFYPTSNKSLYEKVLAKDGCIISEFLPHEEPIKATFPMRNRIIAGLARGTVIIEAAEKSGSLITASHAFSENREVYAIPSDVTRPQGKGCNMIIKKQMAKLVTNAEDILEDFGLDVDQASSSDFLLNIDQKYKPVLEKISFDKFTSDELAMEMGLEIFELNSLLTELELEGVILKDEQMKWTRR